MDVLWNLSVKLNEVYIEEIGSRFFIPIKFFFFPKLTPVFFCDFDFFITGWFGFGCKLWLIYRISRTGTYDLSVFYNDEILLNLWLEILLSSDNST